MAALVTGSVLSRVIREVLADERDCRIEEVAATVTYRVHTIVPTAIALGCADAPRPTSVPGGYRRRNYGLLTLRVDAYASGELKVRQREAVAFRIEGRLAMKNTLRICRAMHDLTQESLVCRERNG